MDTTPRKRPAGTAHDRARIGTKPLRLAQNGYQDSAWLAVAPRPAWPHRPPDPVAGGSVAASKMRISPSSPPGTQPRCSTHAGEPPKRNGHARHARRSTWWIVVADSHLPTRSNVSHPRTTLWPSDLGESGWPCCVAGASRICTDPLGRRVRHFGARNRIFCYRIRWSEGPPSIWAPRRARRSLGIHSGLLQAGFVPIWPQSCVVPAGFLLGVVTS